MRFTFLLLLLTALLPTFGSHTIENKIKVVSKSSDSLRIEIYSDHIIADTTVVGNLNFKFQQNIYNDTYISINDKSCILYPQKKTLITVSSVIPIEVNFNSETNKEYNNQMNISAVSAKAYSKMVHQLFRDTSLTEIQKDSLGTRASNCLIHFKQAEDSALLRSSLSEVKMFHLYRLMKRKALEPKQIFALGEPVLKNNINSIYTDTVNEMMAAFADSNNIRIDKLSGKNKVVNLNAERHILAITSQRCGFSRKVIEKIKTNLDTLKQVEPNLIIIDISDSEKIKAFCNSNGIEYLSNANFLSSRLSYQLNENATPHYFVIQNNIVQKKFSNKEFLSSILMFRDEDFK